MNNNSSSSAGTLQEMGNYKAFIPKHLDGSVELKDKRTYKLLEEASVAIGKLNGLCDCIPFVNVFTNMHVYLEAMRSSEIEGTKTDIKDLMDAAIKNRKNNSAILEDEKRILNLHTATHKCFVRTNKENAKISTELLEEINKELFEGIEPENKHAGKIRTVQNYIGGTNIMDAMFVPPPPEILKDLLDNLNNFWYDETSYMPILIKIAIYHLQFETIHPFVDGNGRIGRLLIHLQLNETGLLELPVLCLSKYWKKHRDFYYEAMSAARFSGNMEHWIRFFLSSIKDASNERIETIQKIDKLATHYFEKIKEEYKDNQNYKKLLGYLLERCPLTTVKHVQKLLNLSYQGADKIIKNFEKLGILKEDSGNKRNREYIFQEYNDLVFKTAGATS